MSDFGKDFDAAWKAFEKLADRVGWRKDGKWEFSDGINFDSPEEKPGSLPVWGSLCVGVGLAGIFGSLLSHPGLQHVSDKGFKKLPK